MKSLSLFLLATVLCFGQATTTSTTASAAIAAGDLFVNLTSATGITAPGTLNQINTMLFVDGEAMDVISVSGTYVGVNRGSGGTIVTAHASGALVWVGPPNYFYIQDPVTGSACTASAFTNLPRPSMASGKVYDCVGGQIGPQAYSAFYVSPTNCTFAPTTLTTTNTYIQVGASTLFVLNGLSNAAAGTNTLTCNILVPTHVAALKGAYIQDIVLLVGSQTTAPTSLGTSTLASITFPTPATSETASTVTPVAIGGTVTAVSPTQITTVTTAGSFLSIKTTYSTAVRLSTDFQILQYTFPFLQSAGAAMALNTPGLIVHYRESLP